MYKTTLFYGLAILLAASHASTKEKATTPTEVGFGPGPALPAPEHSLIPTVNIAPAKGWPDGALPVAASGFSVAAFASGLDHPRWLYVLPNGDVLVAETNAPPRPDDNKGVKGAAMNFEMKRAGAAVPSANRITLLRDTNGDGVAETHTVLLDGLNSPFGMALVGPDLYVANSDAVLRFPYVAGQTKITAPGVKFVDLPAGTINHHWTKNIIASRDGAHLYVTVGSNSNVAENGIDAESGRAAIYEIERATGQFRIFASGLRNPVGLGWQPESGALWTAVNERDELGNDLVPDERKLFPAHYWSGAFVGQHGSWNRKPHSGYKVIFIPFLDGKPNGLPEDILTGFLNSQGDAFGRPVGVAIDNTGALLIADDVGNTIWRVTSNPSK